MTVSVSDAGPYDLGTTPPHDTKAFPTGYDGNVTIQDYRDSDGVLTYQANVPFNMQQSPPEGMTTCAPGTSITKKQGERCYFWLSPGNAAVAVWWERSTDRILLKVRGYRSNYAQ